MHDRHSGVGVEVPPVYVEVPAEEEAAGEAESRTEINHDVAEISVASLNLHMPCDHCVQMSVK